eukprot:Sspe_Gene.867::Locus_292_Transcript_1_1_Confidence_1.000_Length_505::g.867::m.867
MNPPALSPPGFVMAPLSYETEDRSFVSLGGAWALPVILMAIAIAFLIACLAHKRRKGNTEADFSHGIVPRAALTVEDVEEFVYSPRSGRSSLGAPPRPAKLFDSSSEATGTPPVLPDRPSTLHPSDLNLSPPPDGDLSEQMVRSPNEPDSVEYPQ